MVDTGENEAKMCNCTLWRSIHQEDKTQTNQKQVPFSAFNIHINLQPKLSLQPSFF